MTVDAWGAVIFDNAGVRAWLWGRVQVTADGVQVTQDNGPTPIVVEVPQARVVCVVRGVEGDDDLLDLVEMLGNAGTIAGALRPPGMGPRVGDDRSPFRDPPLTG